MTTATTTTASASASASHSLSKIAAGCYAYRGYTLFHDGQWIIRQGENAISGPHLSQCRKRSQAREWIDCRIAQDAASGESGASERACTVDINPGDIFSNWFVDFSKCIIVTEVSEEGVMYEDYDGNAGFLPRYEFEYDGGEDGFCSSPWQRLESGHQQWWGWRLVELWGDFNRLEGDCERLNGLIRAAKNSDRHDREWRLMMRQREIAQQAMAKRREIRRAVDLLRFSIEN